MPEEFERDEHMRKHLYTARRICPARSGLAVALCLLAGCMVLSACLHTEEQDSAAESSATEDPTDTGATDAPTAPLPQETQRSRDRRLPRATRP